jgi:hypothetical protein
MQMTNPGFRMHIPVHILQQALDIYLRLAYPAGAPSAVQSRLVPLRDLPADADVPLDLLEQSVPNSAASLAVRLGQPLYPHMKLVFDPCPRAASSTPKSSTCRGFDFLLRVDAHDQHLHAPPGSPDATWLATIRQSNKELVEKIEATWSAASLPTFKDYLRFQLAARKGIAEPP